LVDRSSSLIIIIVVLPLPCAFRSFLLFVRNHQSFASGVELERRVVLMVKISPSEITPEHLFLNRRQFMVGAGSAAALVALAACGGPEVPPVAAAPAVPTLPLDQLPEALGHAEPFCLHCF